MATAATVAVMFLCLNRLQPWTAGWQGASLVAGTAASLLTSLGVYRLLADGLRWLFRRSLALRRMILGRSFLEGTWVGHYLRGDQHFFTVEFIDQSSGVAVVRGREFDSSGHTRASWNSDSVALDLERLQMVYSYTCKVFTHKHVQEGLGVFALVCERAGKPPNKLDGYSVDLTDGDRDPNTELKISNRETRDDLALAEARRLFGI